jgi:hypothetical protein
MRSARQEMEQLSDAYFRYVDLDRQLEASRQRTSIILGLLGPDHVRETTGAGVQDCLSEFPEPEDLRKKLRLWRAVREYLRIAGESKVGDVQNFLNGLDMENVTRQAIESAMKRHDDLFEIEKRGHERYIRLKKKVR